jgi:integrase/recombinase XerD
MKLSELISAYVSFKQALGMRYLSQAVRLRSFLHAVGDRDITAVDPSAVEAFLAGTGPASWHGVYGILNGFYTFVRSRGYADSSPLPKTVPKHPEPYRPHIYTTEELNALLAATDALATPMSPLQAATFRTLLLTLYGAGLRISEALFLTIVDVDLPESIMTVRTSKFYKTRLVPVGPRLTEHLRAYLEQRRKLPRPWGEDSTFFATRTGRPLAYDRVRTVFRLLRNRAGIRREDGARYAPRIHDLRHAAAVHRLEAWYREGADVQRLLPLLATYLGHVGVAETQCYLTMTPLLLDEANRRFERYALGEVHHG